MNARVAPITGAETHPLRRRALRDGTPTQEVAYAQDDLPGTVHLGAFDDAGTLVGVSTWALEAWPGEPATPAVRLRGMAVDAGLRRGGYGAALVDAGVAWARSQGAVLVWASARDAALPFYERCGFAVTGDGFVDPPTALPHHDVVRRL